MTVTSANEPVGVVHAEEIYTLKEFSKRTGMRASSLRSARRAGLRVFYVHKHAYVCGRDWIEYVRNSSEQRCQEPVVEAV